MAKLIAALILTLSSVTTVVYAEHRDDRDDHDRDDHKGHSFAAPEIDSSSAISALTLLLGSVVVLRSRVATKR